MMLMYKVSYLFTISILSVDCASFFPSTFTNKNHVSILTFAQKYVSALGSDINIDLLIYLFLNRKTRVNRQRKQRNCCETLKRQEKGKMGLTVCT